MGFSIVLKTKSFCNSFVSSNLLMWKAVTATKSGTFQVCVAVMELTVKGKVPEHDLQICYKRPPPLTGDAMTGQTHTQWWYAHLAGMLLLPMETNTQWAKFIFVSRHHSDLNKQTKKKQHEWLSSIFCLGNLCLPLNCLSFALHTLVILRSCCVTDGQVWRIRAGLFCFFFPWPIFVSDLCDTSLREQPPVVSWSSQLDAKMPFPCVFRLCF